MPKSFGVWTLIALVVGNAVGAGIYTTSGFALADLGSREWVVLAWLVAGLIALMGALSYSMLVRQINESGGEYLYLSRSIHPLAGFVAGWISLLAGFPGAIAFAATAFESYARASISSLVHMPGDSLAVAVILIAGIIHIGRVKFGTKVHEWVVVFMLLALTLLIVAALWKFSLTAELPSINTQPLTKFSLFAFANSLVWISLSYSGFNAAAYVAGEVPDASTAVPRGMVFGTLLTIILCVSVNAIILYSAPIEVLRGQADIATKAAAAIGGETAQRIVEFVIAISLLTSITAMVLAGPRVYAKMAQDGALPKFFCARSNEPPRASIALQVIVAIFLVLLADLRGLLSYLGLTLSLCLALAVSSLFVQHCRNNIRPSSAWYPVAPLVFVVCTVFFAVLTGINNPANLFAALPTLIIGSAMYAFSRFWRKK